MERYERAAIRGRPAPVPALSREASHECDGANE